MNAYAVVTGASQGLGKSFSISLAKRKVNLVLISLPEQGLASFANQLMITYGIHCLWFETNLADSIQLQNLIEAIQNGPRVFILINNAGLGGSLEFEKATPNYLEQLIGVNIRAITLLTHALLPKLKKETKAYILNVSSLAAFSPIGYKTIYPATKAFVHSFSRGLYQELKNSSVFVSVVNPGAMATNLEISNRIRKQGIWGRMTLLNPDDVAEKCIRNLPKRDTVIVVNPFSWVMLVLLPIWIRLPLLTSAVKRELV